MYTIDDIDVFIFNHERTTLLAETIDSVLKNTIVPRKITVLDNESTVNVKEVTDRYKDFGVEYIKTYGYGGNHYKALELASKKFIIRLHDDNLLHPEFFEKVLFALNNFKNIVAVTSSYEIFETGSDKTLPEEYPKSYINSQHIQNNFLILTSPKDFMINVIKSNVFPFETKFVGGTPFLVIETKLFREYIPKTDKYGKADDVDLFLYLNAKGHIACIYDTRIAYFRCHQLRDSKSDDNSLTLEQAENWIKLISSEFVNESSKDLWLDIIEFIYRFYPDFVKKEVQTEFSPYALIRHCIDKKILPEFCYKYLKIVPNFETCIKLKAGSKKPKLSKLRKIFSVINDYSSGKREKKLIILGKEFKI